MKPADLREDVAFRGKQRKYAEVRYGSENSRRVAVVVDEVSADDWDLYIDADRNREKQNGSRPGTNRQAQDDEPERREHGEDH